MGEWVKAEFERLHLTDEIVYIEARDHAGLAGELKRGTGTVPAIALVVGIDELSMDRLGHEKFSYVQEISSSPMAILINKTRAPQALSARGYHFKTWREVWNSGLLKKSIVVQDPRFSQPGLAWLMQTHSTSDLSAKQNHDFVRRVFPSWSASFKAFEEGEGMGIWTYSSSLSYFDCEAKPHDYVYLDVDEGYVTASEFAAVVQGSAMETRAMQFAQFMLSEAAQKKLVALNWVYPVANIKMPNCFLPRSKFKILSGSVESSAKQISQWVDEWQLF